MLDGELPVLQAGSVEQVVHERAQMPHLKLGGAPQTGDRGTGLVEKSVYLPHTEALRMKPYIVVHMTSSLDGRSLTDGWKLDFATDLYENTAATRSKPKAGSADA
jgi:hypothetical protein